MKKKYNTVEEWVEVNSKLPISWFYLGAVSKEVNLPSQTVIDVLKNMVETGKLGRMYEVTCEHCLGTLDKVNTISEIKDSYDCMFCGEEIEIDDHYCNVEKIYFFRK